MSIFRIHTLRRSVWRAVFTLSAAALLVAGPVASLHAAGADTDPNKDAPDVILFTNGDQLTGKFIREVGGTVTFHSDIAGDLNIGWDKIKELRTSQKVSVLAKGVVVTRKTPASQVPSGVLKVSNQQIELEQAANGQTIAPIPVANAAYIIDNVTMEKQLRGHPGFFQGWNGAATAGATLVQATQNQYTFSGALGLVRTEPTVNWLTPRNRTEIGFNASYGKITEPSFTSGGVFTPSNSTKSDLYHAEAERDEYISPRVYYLGQVAFDHNFSQSLSLQQIYGAGFGFTVIKSPKQQLDVKATVQYERQDFENATAPGQDQSLIGSTFAADYLRKFPRGMIFNQQVSYIPAYNNLHAYSVTETNTLGFPAYKALSFTVGTLDSYLNDPPASEPPTRANSFQFTMGITYNINSKY